MSLAVLSTAHVSTNPGQQQPYSFSPSTLLLERNLSTQNPSLPNVGYPTRAAASADTRSRSPRQADHRHMNTPAQGAMPMAGDVGLPPLPPNAGWAASAPPAAVNPSTLVAPTSVQATSDYRELVDVLSRASPDTVRQVIRDRWENSLLGSDFHTAFILNLLFVSANPAVMALVVQKTGERMVKASKKQILAHLTTNDLDELADLILAKASNEFLDKSMACRLETVSARRLLNALARAERLGYNISDIVEENSETVIASAGSGNSTPTAYPQSLQAQAAASRQASGSPAQMNRNVAYPPATASTSPYGIVHCTRCGRPCSGDQAFRYHAMRRACEHTDKVERINVDICPHCGCLFTSNGGLAYHVKSKVCGDYNGATEQAVIAELRARPVRARGDFASLPTQPIAMASRSGPATPSRVNGSADDPYSKLTPEARRNFEMEMRQAEEKYGAMMHKALSYPAHEREDYLQRIKNSFNSKQSTTRKKYGIRLRERRTKAEIEEDRVRVMNDTAPSAKRSRLDDGTPLQAATGVGGGLVETAAQPALVDPTTTTPAGLPMLAPTGTSDDPMQIADDSSNSTDSEDDDIPARLPPQHLPA
ncbi:hypothetical protein L249_3497 [Ophiocordyceps polyrhachis-furcata BCC 54312]|uniref:Uncharacterized protein n=1 Tax=Ophiocordyceps polyrhachis-furcata BCC 54312 TaxID=1330021 RepID=A0A367LMA6_9HYPO|nr:hypothetical protein L249_3497 [Ophiocordyceps polyrhachis-furcata BCC 54312]